MSHTVPGDYVVTVDGPAGSGKSTLGRRLASTLGLPLVDTGLFYRGVMVAALRAGVGPQDRERLVSLAASTKIDINSDPAAADSDETLHVDGVAAAGMVRDPASAHLLSSLSQIPQVRAQLLQPQRLAAAAGAVAVGRDCGTVVFPDAVVKLYLEATETVRQERRAAQLQRQGHSVGPQLLRGEVGDRDRNDAPAMRPAADAIRIDTDRLGIEEMVLLAIERCRVAGLLGLSRP